VGAVSRDCSMCVEDRLGGSIAMRKI